MKRLLFFTAFCWYSLWVNATDSTTIVIHFYFNKFDITNAEKDNIHSFLKSIDTANNIITQVNVFGHTDQIGSHFYNDKLSVDRANATVDYLIKCGIEKQLIHLVLGFGKHQLLTKLMSEAERATNRRATVIAYFTKKKKAIVEAPIEQPKLNIGNTLAPKSKTQKLSDKIEDTALKVGDKIELPYILFVGGEHIFLQISYPYLDELLDVMIKNPTLEIEIQGHVCCTNEDDGYDFSTGKKNLSVARAKAVYDYLKNNNIDKSRMRFIGFGHQFPITLERTEGEKIRNRRVEIKILHK